VSGIEAAFFGALGRAAELKTSKAGKPYLPLNIRVGDGDQAQWVSVTSFHPDAIAVTDKLVKGAQVYIEGAVKLDEWTAQDGTKRHGLSVLSWHTRLAGIGRNRPKREERIAAAGGDFHNDPIPEWGR
jgi:single-strand DNA-binding protein